MDELVTKICPCCGKAFEVERGIGLSSRKYCSSECCKRMPNELRKKHGPKGNCLTCGASLEDKPPEAKYCSRKCAGIGWMKSHGNHLYVCKRCGKEFKLCTGRKQLFCSWDCWTAWRKARTGKQEECQGSPANERSDTGANREAVCPVCGDGFTFMRGRGRARIYCSPRCRDLACGRRGSSVRRARKLSGNDIEQIDAFTIFNRDGWRCGICGKAVKRDATYPDPMSASLDHIMPLCRGGLHTQENVQCAHLGCNLHKNVSGGGQLRLAIRLT